MGLNLRYSPLEWDERAKTFDFGNATITGFQANPSGGADYYVDGNTVNPVQDGKSWATAYDNITAAIAASDKSIGLSVNRWWARRNRIFVVGDTLSETLVKFPTKCDVIGVGAYDTNPMPGITGHHVPIGESYSTRFFNIAFVGIATAAPIITLASTSGGTEFHGCIFDALAGTLTSGILNTASMGMKVVDCDFRGTFVTSYITFGTGNAGRCGIIGNRMLGTAASGIVAGSGMTGTTGTHLIDGNVIHATGECITDSSSLFFITNNRMISDATVALAAGAGGITCNELFASGNKIGGKDTVTNADYPFVIQMTS